MDQPLTSSLNGDDSASQSSQRSGLSGSLIERIRAQRERENAAANTVGAPATGPAMVNSSSIPPPQATTIAAPTSQISVPNYDNQIPTGIGNADIEQQHGGGILGGGGEIFSNAWNSVTNSMSSMQYVGVSDTDVGVSGGDGVRDALLGPSSMHHHDEEYSMVAYFQTFVIDMYNLFRALPVFAQAIIVVILVFIAWKLL